MRTTSVLGAAAALLIGSSNGDVVPNSCNDLEDGTYLMKLIDSDDYPLVSIKCSNGYGILDYSHDSDISEYFDTFTQWFPKTGGPDNSVHINWQEWFLPHTTAEDTNAGTSGAISAKEGEASDGGNANAPQTRYAISPDCDVCEYDHKRQIYKEGTTYWMTGTIFGCFWGIKGAHNCDYDYDTTDCHSCSSVTGNGADYTLIDDDSGESEYTKTGICPHNVKSSDYSVPTTHDDCGESISLKPSIGIEGQYCVCFQQQSTQYFEIDDNAISEKQNNFEKIENAKELEAEEEAADTSSSEDVYYLYQKDFKDGTYRIQKAGTYKIMEDIVFDFNANVDEPNKEYAYLPKVDQADNYPGAGTYRNAYFTGFFAGITIETDDVVLDLGGHTLKQSEYFYYQQRWFTTIELTTQYFLPGQGIGNFGADPHISHNVVIKNGILGLTSHHGIHGNFNSNIWIDNIKIIDWETHGIQMNGFDTIKLTNIEIAETTKNVKFSGEYAQMRQLLWRYKNIADEIEESYENGEIEEDDLYIQFYGRNEKTTMREIADEIEYQMNLAFDYAVKGKSLSPNDDDYDSFVSAKKLFVNNNGYLPLGAAMYGIFLNTFGASIFTYNLATSSYSSSATLENIKIHGLRHRMVEYSMIEEKQSRVIFVNPFNAPLFADEMIDGIGDVNNNDDVMKIMEAPTYRGNIILDAAVASNKFSNSFDYLGLQMLRNDFLLPWATGTDLTTVTSQSVSLVCAIDAMVHTSKGINGLRLDGVEDVTMKNIEIYDIIDLTEIGSNNCGNYDTEFRATAPMQTGFSGNMNQAININSAMSVTIEDVNIHDIESQTGQTFGISIWPACEVTLKGDIKLSNFNAGSQIAENTFTYDDLPNKAPEVCGVRVYYEYSDYSTDFDDSEANYMVDYDSMMGHAGCFGTDNVDYLTKDQFSQTMGSGSSGASFKSLGNVGKTSNNNSFNNLFSMNNIVILCVVAIALLGVAFKYYGNTASKSYGLLNDAQSNNPVSYGTQ